MLLRRFFGSGSGPRARTGHLAPSTGDCHWPPPLANRNGDVCLADGHKRRLYTGAPHGHTPIHPDSVHPAHPHAYVDLHRHADALGHANLDAHAYTLANLHSHAYGYTGAADDDGDRHPPTHCNPQRHDNRHRDAGGYRHSNAHTQPNDRPGDGHTDSHSHEHP